MVVESMDQERLEKELKELKELDDHEFSYWMGYSKRLEEEKVELDQKLRYVAEKLSKFLIKKAVDEGSNLIELKNDVEKIFGDGSE